MDLSAPAGMILFGPQKILPSIKRFQYIQHYLAYDHTLNEILEELSTITISQILPTLVEACPALDCVSSQRSLMRLETFARTGCLTVEHEDAVNSILMPITIVDQMVAFLQSSSQEGTLGLNFLSLPSIVRPDIQGFCTGFLTAVAFSCSKEKQDLAVYAASALHLAVCIGDVVDANPHCGSFANFTKCTPECSSIDILSSILKSYPEVRCVLLVLLIRVPHMFMYQNSAPP